MVLYFKEIDSMKIVLKTEQKDHEAEEDEEIFPLNEDI